MSAETKLTMIRGPTMVVLVGTMNRCSPTSRKRHSPSAAFLAPVANRPNLKVLTGATVQKLLFNNDRCTGVTYVSGGKQLTVFCEDEIILCGGTIASPQLLMLSGIGNAEELRKAGVKARHHLPGVGKNLQGHLLCSV